MSAERVNIGEVSNDAYLRAIFTCVKFEQFAKRDLLFRIVRIALSGDADFYVGIAPWSGQVKGSLVACRTGHRIGRSIHVCDAFKLHLPICIYHTSKMSGKMLRTLVTKLDRDYHDHPKYLNTRLRSDESFRTLPEKDFAGDHGVCYIRIYPDDGCRILQGEIDWCRSRYLRQVPRMPDVLRKQVDALITFPQRPSTIDPPDDDEPSPQDEGNVLQQWGLQAGLYPLGSFAFHQQSDPMFYLSNEDPDVPIDEHPSLDQWTKMREDSRVRSAVRSAYLASQSSNTHPSTSQQMPAAASSSPSPPNHSSEESESESEGEQSGESEPDGPTLSDLDTEQVLQGDSGDIQHPESRMHPNPLANSVSPRHVILLDSDDSDDEHHAGEVE